MLVYYHFILSIRAYFKEFAYVCVEVFLQRVELLYYLYTPYLNTDVRGSYYNSTLPFRHFNM